MQTNIIDLTAALTNWTPPPAEAPRQEAAPRAETMSPEAKTRRAALKLADADHVAEIIRTEAPDILPHTRRVGAWLWVEFPEKPTPETLAKIKELGFTWNRTRKAWQNPCGVFRRANRRIDPRAVYGEESL